MNQWRIFWLLALILVIFFLNPSYINARTPSISETSFSQSTIIPLTLRATQPLFAGDTLWLEIGIGNPDMPVTDLFGLSFRLNYDSAKWLPGIPNPEGKIVTRGEFWPQNAFIFSRHDTLLNQFQVAITQLAGMPGLTGSGSVAWLRFAIHPHTPDSTVLNFWLNHIVAINSQKDTLQLVSNELKVIIFRHPMFNLKCQPRNLSINWGESARYQVFLDSTRYLREKVKLSCLINPEFFTEFIPREISKNDTAELLIQTKPAIFREEDLEIVVQGHILQFFGTDTVRLQVTSPPFFRMRVTPDNFTVFAGDSASFLVYSDSVWDCKSKIHLSCPNFPAGIGSGYFNPDAIFPGDTSHFTIMTNLNAPPGEYVLKIIGQGNNFVDSTNFILKIVQQSNFSLVVTPPYQSILAGQTAEFVVKLDSVRNYTGSVHLQIGSFPSETGMTVILPDSIALNDSATITIGTKLSTPPEKYLIFISGMAGGLTKTTSFLLEILPRPDFMLQVHPLAQTIAAGESTSFQIEIAPLHNFQNAVTLSYSFSNGTNIAAQIAFTNPKILPGQSSNLTIVTTRQTRPADYRILIQAKADTLTHDQWVNLVITTPLLAAEWILPNPFTPNQDGFNDQVHFNLHHIESDGTILIFNFSGRKVREMRNVADWDGTDESGAALPMGIYFYMVKIQNEIKARGSLTLVR